MKTSVGDLIGGLMNAVDVILLGAQETEGIESGDVAPMDAYLIDDCIESLAALLMRVLEYEKDGFPYKN